MVEKGIAPFSGEVVCPLRDLRRSDLHPVQVAVQQMGPDRNQLIAVLRSRLQADPRVLACWLEGADATGNVDAFSDIDFCVAVIDGAIAGVTQEARKALTVLGRLDIDHQLVADPDRHHVVFHVDGAAPDVLVDFCVYVDRGSTFVSNDPIERPLVLFDRADVVRFVDPQARLQLLEPAQRLQALRRQVAEHRRVLKHVRRGEFLEAFGYYQRWVLEPLIEAQRMLHTPLHPDYSIVHVSRHLPAPVVERLERLFQVASLEELEAKVTDAVVWFEETADLVHEEIGARR
jgi:hypothetical protein